MTRAKEESVGIAGKEWTREKRLASLIRERGLATRGFRRALRLFVREYLLEDKGSLEIDDEYTLDDCVEHLFSEWFGACDVVPAAFRITREADCDIYADSQHAFTVEVYEVENSIEITRRKLGAYGRIADGDGPRCELHILDRYDNEFVVPQETLECFCFAGLMSVVDRKESEDFYKKVLKDVRSKAAVQHHSTVIVDDAKAKELEREVAKLRRGLAKVDYDQGRRITQNIIYGLGCGVSHKEIARQEGVSPEVVRAIRRLLAARSVEPTTVVKDSHARWKAAYDAVRELGVQL